MRIALLTYSTKPRGGVVHTLALAEAFARAGHQVTVWALARGGDTAFFRPVTPAVRVRLVPVPEIDGESVGDRILRSIALLADAFSGGFDVVHAQDCLTANAVGRARGYAGLWRTVHHLDRFTTPELAACHERAIVEPAELVCVSEAVAAEVRSGWGREPAVIGNGVDAARFARAAESGAGAPWRERYGRYVLAVGGIEPRKGTLELVEAMAALGRPEVPLLVAGGDTLFDYRPYRAEVFARAAELGVEPVVLGPVDDAALPGLVAGAAVFAFPSTKEGFGLAAMEALAAGVPLVTRDLPVLREVFGAAARFAHDPESFAREFASVLDGSGVDGDPELDPAHATVGRALAAAHTWDAAAAAHLALYRRG
ncbi:MSMEG_0565 family glycosyltransferase [Actinomycetospora chlora]|uniref:MSMEG_0565 family glycosyltransferase n=1 Tax=Actinomycetospora chlora TaxID=663608 RepID=A0ABP9BJ52_9PSEU